MNFYEQCQCEFCKEAREHGINLEHHGEFITINPDNLRSEMSPIPGMELEDALKIARAFLASTLSTIDKFDSLSGEQSVVGELQTVAMDLNNAKIFIDDLLKIAIEGRYLMGKRREDNGDGKV